MAAEETPRGGLALLLVERRNFDLDVHGLRVAFRRDHRPAHDCVERAVLSAAAFGNS